MERLSSGKTSRSGCYLARKEEGRILDLVDPSRPHSLLGCVQDPSLAMQTWRSPVATSAGLWRTGPVGTAHIAVIVAS